MFEKTLHISRISDKTFKSEMTYYKSTLISYPNETCNRAKENQKLTNFKKRKYGLKPKT